MEVRFYPWIFNYQEEIKLTGEQVKTLIGFNMAARKDEN